MSDETTPDLREQIAEALKAEHHRRAKARIAASPEEHSAAMADAAMAVVQPELDRLAERIPYREGETEEQYLERQVARWRSEAWQARGKLRKAEAMLASVRAILPELDGTILALQDHQLPLAAELRYDLDRLKAALDQPAESKET